MLRGLWLFTDLDDRGDKAHEEARHPEEAGEEVVQEVHQQPLDVGPIVVLVRHDHDVAIPQLRCGRVLLRPTSQRSNAWQWPSTPFHSCRTTDIQHRNCHVTEASPVSQPSQPFDFVRERGAMPRDAQCFIAGAWAHQGITVSPASDAAESFESPLTF